EELCAWLAAQTPEELVAALGRPETWPRLLVLVRLQPDGRLTLPVRADFSQQRAQRQHLDLGKRAHATVPTEISGSAYNIGQVYLRSETPLWYTLAEVLAGIVRDGVLPPIIEALAFEPSAEQVETRPVTLAGRVIDPRREVLWTRCIDLRREVKQAADD